MTSVANIPENHVPPIYLDPTQRLPEIQQKVDQAFHSVAQHIESSWGLYNGDEEYVLCGVREYELMKRVILQAPPGQTEFYVLDIGAGNFQWGKGLARFIDAQADLPQGIKVHIIGIRGEQFFEERTVQTDRCTIHQLGAFKVEELFAEFQRQGFDVINKFDLMVSRWCFRHLADPVGTFVQTYNLLRPGTGVLLMDGFFFVTRDGDPKGMPFNRNMTQLFLDTQAPFLTAGYNMSGSLNHFMLRRPDERACQLPMQYQGCLDVGGEWHSGSHSITQFTRQPQPTDLDEFYCGARESALRGDKAMHEWLKKNRVLCDARFTWGPLQPKDAYQMTPALHAAVLEGDIQAVTVCLQSGCDVDESDAEGRTAIHIAVQTQNRAIFQLLLDQRADVNFLTAESRTPLHEAATLDTTGQFVQALIRARAEVNREIGTWDELGEEEGPSPLECARKAGNAVAAELLLEAGAL